MGARVGRSTKIVLELLIRQVYIIQSLKQYIAILLLIDISRAFDIVNPIRMLDILRKKRLLYWIIQQVQAFITQRSTTLVIQRYKIPLFPIEVGVLQGSLLSLILFLLYIVELYEIYNRLQEGLLGIGFIDNINLLAYLKSIEANYRKLEQAYRKLLQQAKKYRMKFILQKYKLIHFIRCKGFNL